MIRIFDSDGSEGDVPHNTVVVQDQDVKRDLALWELMTTDKKLNGFSGAKPIMTVLEKLFRRKPCNILRAR